MLYLADKNMMLRRLFSRSVLLFVIGAVFTIVLTFLQLKRHWPSLQFYELILKLCSVSWWLPILCGSVSVIIGLLYPLFICAGDHMQEWSKVLRCAAMFIGINEACIKIDFSSNWQLFLSLAVLSFGLWWYFDRTSIGLVLGISFTFLTVIAAKLLIHRNFYWYSEREFSYIQSWLPCVVFSGGVTIGNIGKQLAVNDFVDASGKKHAE